MSSLETCKSGSIYVFRLGLRVSGVFNINYLGHIKPARDSSGKAYRISHVRYETILWNGSESIYDNRLKY